MRIVAAVLAMLMPLQAFAQAQPSSGPRLAFSLGAGVSALPSYFGSDSVEAGPALTFDFDALSVGPLSLGGDPDAIPDGLGFRGSFRYVPERSAEDHDELAGLDDIDAAFEIGGGVSYSQPWYEAFVVARTSFGGSDALVGEVGMDLISRPSDRLTLRAGPRVLIGSDDYAATYFGVSEEEAAASILAGNPFSETDASGGVLSSGVELGAGYRFSDSWGVDATVRYDRLQGDAESSPITTEDGQVSATVEVTRRFDFRF